MAIDYSRCALPKSPSDSEELWTPIPFDNLYEVSSRGRVRSWIQKGGPLCLHGTRRAAPKLIKLEPRGKGRKSSRPYLSVAIRGKYYAVHRLVLEAFVGSCPPGLEAAHLNGHLSDNRLVNLRWVTRKENASHRLIHGTDMATVWRTNPDAFRRGQSVKGAKLTDDSVRNIRVLYDDGQTTCSEIARMFGVSQQLVSLVGLRRAWRHVK